MMKRLLPVLVLLLASPCWATWTLTQVKDAISCANPCAVTVTSTGAGHLLVAGFLSSTTAITITSVTAAACSSTWTHATNAAASGTGDGSADLYYCLNSASGQTSISITGSGSPAGIVGIIWEASSSLGSIAVDSGATPSGNKTDTTCTACAGVSLILSGNNDFIAALAACGGTCSGLTGTGWTNDLTNPSGDGVAHGITSGTQTAPATWTQTSGTLVSNAAAFQESSGAAAPSGFNKRQKIEKLEGGV